MARATGRPARGERRPHPGRRRRRRRWRDGASAAAARRRQSVPGRLDRARAPAARARSCGAPARRFCGGGRDRGDRAERGARRCRHGSPWRRRLRPRCITSWTAPTFVRSRRRGPASRWRRPKGCAATSAGCAPWLPPRRWAPASATPRAKRCCAWKRIQPSRGAGIAPFCITCAAGSRPPKATRKARCAMRARPSRSPRRRDCPGSNACRAVRLGVASRTRATGVHRRCSCAPRRRSPMRSKARS